MSTAIETRVQFVCLRAEHHRLRPVGSTLRQYLGHSAYCPAGDVGDHDWMPVATDLLRLARVGFLYPLDEPEATDTEPPSDDDLVLMRR